MPPQSGKSRFTGVMKENAAKPVEFPEDYSDLPGGITSAEGIAALSVLRIQPYKSGTNKGKLHLYGAGIVESPKEAMTRKMVWNPKMKRAELVEGSVRMMKTTGGRTNIMMPLCSTGKGDRAVSEDENIELMNNMLKRLFGQNFMAENGIETDEDLDLFLENAGKANPPIRFRFSTQWNPPHVDESDGTVYEDGTWPHKWHGTQGLKDYVPDAPENKEAAVGPPAPPPPPASKGTAAAAPEPPHDGKHLDFDLMVKKAEAKDMDARKRLREAAAAQGWTEEQIDDPSKVGFEDTWGGVAEMAKQGPPSGPVEANQDNGDAPQDAAEWVPAVGDSVYVQLRGPDGKPARDKNKKPKPMAQAEIKKVYAKDETADCLDSDDKKTIYPKVPFADLSQA